MSFGFYIENDEQLQQALQRWKSFSFNASYLPLHEAIKTLNSDQRVVDKRHQYAPRWHLVYRGTKREAVFHTVGLWRWNSNLETGNYVPPGQTAPARLAEQRIQNAPNNLCQFSYCVDTYRDKSLWVALKAFEDFVKQDSDFNEHGKDRRDWQSGKEGDDSSFILTSQIFCKRTPYTRAKEASLSYPLHEWIAQATRKGMEYYANPDRPSIFEPANGELRNIRECEPPYLKVGDMVWMSFTVEFFIGSKYWSTNFIPYEIVRIGKVSTDLLADLRNFAVDEEDELPRARLEAGLRIPSMYLR
ncbi:hypothetical protein C8Q76DRAFT_633237 [Earliella scabrosa]|nr:hypothetical protein C8Q76DRAFT_633237 [Earliella scabrosa]